MPGASLYRRTGRTEGNAPPAPGAPPRTQAELPGADLPAAGGVKSAMRVLELFDYFDTVRRPARVGEIAFQLGYPQSSTSVLLRSLVAGGYLDYQADKRSFVPSLRIASLGSWLTDCFVPRGTLTEVTDELSRETGHTVIIGARSGLDAQYVHVVEATNALRLHVAPGTRRVFACSAIGFVLMASLKDEDILALVRRTNAEMMPGRTRLDAKATLRRVEGVRKDGYVYSRGLISPGAGMIAVAVPTEYAPGAQPLAIALAGAVDQFDRMEAELFQALRNCIARRCGPGPAA